MVTMNINESTFIMIIAKNIEGETFPFLPTKKIKNYKNLDFVSTSLVKFLNIIACTGMKFILFPDFNYVITNKQSWESYQFKYTNV